MFNPSSRQAEAEIYLDLYEFKATLDYYRRLMYLKKKWSQAAVTYTFNPRNREVESGTDTLGQEKNIRPERRTGVWPFLVLAEDSEAFSLSIYGNRIFLFLA